MRIRLRSPLSGSATTTLNVAAYLFDELVDLR